jgi:F0F1-type ATP synthase membrane subunit c/vacuolar-type H+-ATPase subunit K
MTGLILVLVMLTVTVGPSIVIAVLGYATIKALGRNPSAASKIFMGTLFLLVFVEAIAIISMLVIFQLFSGS